MKTALAENLDKLRKEKRRKGKVSESAAGAI